MAVRGTCPKYRWTVEVNLKHLSLGHHHEVSFSESELPLPLKYVIKLRARERESKTKYHTAAVKYKSKQKERPTSPGRIYKERSIKLHMDNPTAKLCISGGNRESGLPEIVEFYIGSRRLPQVQMEDEVLCLQAYVKHG